MHYVMKVVCRNDGHYIAYDPNIEHWRVGIATTEVLDAAASWDSQEEAIKFREVTLLRNYVVAVVRVKEEIE